MSKEAAIKIKDIGLYDVAAFYSQQSVEKLLKTILIFETGTAPKIHYLDELARLLHIPDEIFKYVEGISEDYRISRYPDVGLSIPFESYNLEDAIDRIERAKFIFKSLKWRYLKLEVEHEK